MLHIRPNYKFKKNIISTTLIITVFIILVLFSATQFLINIAKLNITGTDQIITGKRAIQAAKSGIEWGLVNIIKNHACFAQTTITINEPGLNGFTVNITCEVISDHYQLYAQAIYGTFGSNHYANRSINVKYAKATIDNLSGN